MAARIGKSSLFGALRARPSSLTAARAVPFTARAVSTVPTEDPKQKANSIVESLPGNSLLTKAAILSGGTAAAVAAISNELYVVNEESIVAFSLLTVIFGIGKFAGPLYSDWARQQSNKVKDILNAAREEHTAAVQQRIANVKDLSSVVEITKSLFEVSKDTARLEAQAFELEQRTALAAEAKSVLDSWVRYEGQVKQRQQSELADSVISKIEKDLQNPKVLKQILDQSVADVERILSAKR